MGARVLRQLRLPLAAALVVAAALPVFARDPSVKDRVADASESTAAASLPEPLFHRQPTFYLPYSVPNNPASPVDVVLFISADYGRTWEAYARQPAHHRHFLVRVTRDGEYWFASRTFPVSNAIPEGLSPSPELRIIVDTNPPRLNLDARVDTQGHIVAVWEAADPWLDTDSVVLEYQSGPGQSWSPVDVRLNTPDVGGSELKVQRGETRWRPERWGALISVRLRARDHADNIQDVTRRLLPPLALPTPLQSSPSGPENVPADPFPQQVAEPPRPLPLPPAPEGDAPADPETLDSGATQSEDTREVPENGLARTDTHAPSTEEGGAADHDAEPVEAASGEGSAEDDSADPSEQDANEAEDNRTPARLAANPKDEEVWPSDRNSEAATTPEEPTDEEHREREDDPHSDPFQEPFPAESLPTEGGDPPPDAAEVMADDTATSWSLPEGERPRMTNSRRFNLDYSIDAVGPDGVERVELWVTRNGGRDWDLWGVDHERESPFLVEVQDEGLYGFRVVIIGANGLSSRTPRSGDPADLWVGVDTTPPLAEIHSASFGKDEQAGHLDIRWTARDANLGARPVTLRFSERPEGPWTTIASGLPNTGKYQWRIDSRVPESFHLRIEVRDEAGNLGVHQLDEPIASSGLAPQGRIRGVEPLSP